MTAEPTFAPTPRDLLAARMNLLPLGPDKRPVTRWKALQERPLTAAELAAVWEERAPVALANITGHASRRWTLDADGEEGCETLARLGLLDLAHRKTPSGGRHVDFWWPGAGPSIPTLNCKSSPALAEIVPGCDIRGEGGYAGVWRQDGAYVWLRPIDPEPMDVAKEALPDLLALCASRARTKAEITAVPAPVCSVVSEEEIRRRTLHALASREGAHDGLLAVGRAFPDADEALLDEIAALLPAIVSASRPGGRVPDKEECLRAVHDGARFARERGIAPPRPNTRRNGATPSERRLIATHASEVKVETARFIDPDRMIPAGALSLLAGDPGLGKSTFAAKIAAAMSRRAAGYSAGAVLFVSGEDSPSTTLVPRLMAERADLSRVSFVAAEAEGAPDGLRLPDDVERLAALIREHNARLVIIDPLNAHLSGEINGHRDQDIRRALAPLHRVAEDSGVAVLLIMHLNKSAGGHALYRVGGSIGSVGAARSAILFTAHPKDDAEGEDVPAEDISTLRVAHHLKNNVGPLAGSHVYRIEAATVTGASGEVQTSRLAYVGTGDFDAAELLDPPKSKPSRRIDEAREWLREHLADATSRPSAEVKAAGERAGFSRRTIERAAKDVAVAEEIVDASGRRTTWTLRPFGRQGVAPKGVAPTGSLALGATPNPLQSLTFPAVAEGDAANPSVWRDPLESNPFVKVNGTSGSH